MIFQPSTQSTEAPAYAGARAPNLPALIDALPSDATRPAQTEFTRERQVAFIENLATTGSARSAAKAAGVSHQTVYRMRRASPDFRLAWDAALLAARAQAEEVLASRALDGVEEEVWYHGEVVATRRRYDARLLLAHLARLDRLTADARTNAFAEDFEVALARFERGEAQPEVTPVTSSSRAEPVEARSREALRQAQGEREREADISSSGQCNTRSMSRPEAAAPAPPCRDCGGWCDTPGATLTAADCMWLGNCLARMDAARPRGAPLPHELVCGIDEVDACEALQWQAFEAGVDRWWLVVPPGYDDTNVDADPGAWHYAEDEK